MRQFVNSALGLFLLKKAGPQDFKFSPWITAISVLMTGALYGFLDYSQKNGFLGLNLLIGIIFQWVSFIILYKFMQWWLPRKSGLKQENLVNVLGASVFWTNWLPIPLIAAGMNPLFLLLFLVVISAYAIFVIAHSVSTVYEGLAFSYVIKGALFVFILQVIAGAIGLEVQANLIGQ